MASGYLIIVQNVYDGRHTLVVSVNAGCPMHQPIASSHAQRFTGYRDMRVMSIVQMFQEYNLILNYCMI